MIEKQNDNNTFIFLLKIATFCVFFGRAYQHIFWNAPYTSLFWDQSLLSGIIESIFNTKWQDYATSMRVSNAIDQLVKVIGFFYLICALLILKIKEESKSIQKVIIAGGLSLLILTLLYFKEKFFQIGMLIEFSAQWMSPFILIMALNKKISPLKIILISKIACSLTFLGHGLYAMGFHPLPGNFIDMFIGVFKLKEKTAAKTLSIIGQCDLLFSVGVFFKIDRYILPIAVVWGFLTSLARPISVLSIDFSLNGLHQSWFECIYRLPHTIIPLAIFLFLRENKKN